MIDGNRAPKDLYAGADKAALKDRLLAAWKAQYPKDEVLDVRFSMENWKREVQHVWEKDRFRTYDVSRLIVTVILKTSDTIATLYVAGFYKDPMAGDSQSVHVVERGSGSVYNQMRIENLRK